MAKLSDAQRLARLLAILHYLRGVDRATVGELAARFGGSPRSLYDDLLAAWTAEDPVHTGLFPLHLQVEYCTPGEPEYRPIPQRECWLSTATDQRSLDRLLEECWKPQEESNSE